MFLDDSACNLASFNLMKFVDAKGGFDVTSFRRAVDVVISAQEFIVGNASYPTEKIAVNSHQYRPLGMGYANLGALLMYNGLAYDSDEGRDFAAAITAVMTGEAYLQSARIAAKLGPFPGYPRNRDSFLEVMRMHRNAVQKIDPNRVSKDLLQAAQECWDLAVLEGTVHGYRNAQATVLAPTGTIGFMMDCDTTGVEPDLALVKFKKLVGGGMMKIVNNTVPAALRKLGYSDAQVQSITKYIDENGTIEGAPEIKPEHLPVFDCAFKAQRGTRSIHYMGHIKMMSAVQPFISGAISKTVNVPEATTIEEIMEAYMQAWKLGVKAIAIYRDNSKRTQPLNVAKTAKPAQPEFRPVRRKLPAERRAITHKFSIGGHEGYITVGMYDDGQPGEIFLVMAKEGSAISGLMDSFATAVSLTLQYGVPHQGPDRQVLARALRAVGAHGQPGDPVRQVDRGLHIPLAGLEVPLARRAVPDRRARPGSVARQDRRGHTAQRSEIDVRPGRRAHLRQLRQHHGAQRLLLQVHELRRHQRLFVANQVVPAALHSNRKRRPG